MKPEPAPLDPGAGYFLYHSIGQYPGKTERTAEALAGFARAWGSPDDGAWDYSLRLRKQFIDRWSRCIEAEAGSIALAENVTSALHSLVGSLSDSSLRGKRVLIAADCFPSLHFLLAGMAQRRGFTLDTVPLRPGESWVRNEDFLARWKPDVALALLTWVTSTASHRCDLDALIAHGHSVGSLVGVDITQGVGLLPFSISRIRADFAVSTTLKWLCGTAGAGMLYARPALLPRCHPELRGWFSQENPFAWSLDGFEYAPDARRFDHGTPSIVACAANLPALEWHASQDAGALLAHNGRLSSELIAMADGLGMELASPRDPDERGGSVMLRLPANLAAPALIAALRGQGLHADVRGTTLRLSPGNMTTALGVSRLEGALARYASAG